MVFGATSLGTVQFLYFLLTIQLCISQIPLELVVVADGFEVCHVLFLQIQVRVRHSKAILSWNALIMSCVLPTFFSFCIWIVVSCLLKIETSFFVPN